MRGVSLKLDLMASSSVTLFPRRKSAVLSPSSRMGTLYISTPSKTFSPLMFPTRRWHGGKSDGHLLPSR